MCALFEQLTKTEPKDASLWSDTGLCLMRRDSSAGEHALAALLEAWKLASASPAKGAPPLAISQRQSPIVGGTLR